MLVSYCSDLHLEHGPITLMNSVNSDVLILAGDIFTLPSLESPFFYLRLVHYQEFFKDVCSKWKHVIYVPGNHDYWNQLINKSSSKSGFSLFLRHLRGLDNFHFLNDSHWEYEGILFAGSTLWTSMNNSDPLVMMHSREGMADYHRIFTEVALGESRELTPEDTVRFHKKSVRFIKKLNKLPSDKIVMISHHAPSVLSVNQDRFSVGSSYPFFSNLEELILSSPKIKFWVHGHTHDNFHYQIGETQVLCNPRGYTGYEDISLLFELKHFEIS